MKRPAPAFAAFCALFGALAAPPSASLNSGHEGVLCDSVGQQALDSEQFEEARKRFTAALETAKRARNEPEAASCAFYLGLTVQLQAGESPQRRQELLLEAARLYEAARPRGSDAPGRVVNLAHVYLGLGRPEEAENVFSEAIRKAEARRRTLLMRSFADLLLAEGRWEKAAETYRQVLKDRQGDQSTRAALLRLLLDHSPSALPGAVWDAVEANQMLTAIAISFDALAKAKLTDEDRASLLAAIVAGLARQGDDPARMATSGTAAQLRTLVRDPTLGTGAAQVLTLLGAGPLSPEKFHWWAISGTSYGRSRVASFRALLRSLALRASNTDGRTARTYLDLAEALAPGVADLELYRERMADFSANGDREMVAQALKRWQGVIAQWSEKIPALDQARFHLAAARILKELNYKGHPDQPDSTDYQLRLAVDEARLAKDRDLIETVVAAKKDLEQAGSGGGGGGGGSKWASYDAGGINCAGAPQDPCHIGLVMVPKQSPTERALRAAGRQGGFVQFACGGPRAIGWDPQPARAASQKQLGAHWARLESRRGEDPESQYPPAQSRLSVPSELCALASPQDARRMIFDRAPHWVTSGLWLSNCELVLADSLTTELLRYRVDGVLPTLLAPSPPTTLDRPSKVRSAANGLTVIEKFDGQLEAIYPRGSVLEGRLRGRKGPQGNLEAVYDWVPTGSREVLALGDIQRNDRSWVRALVRAPLDAGEGFELVSQMPLGDPTFVLYRLGNPYLAVVGEKGYFLDLRGSVSLYELSRGSPPRRIAAFGEGLVADFPRLSALETIEAAGKLYRTIEGWRIPGGLYASGDFLFLLMRLPASGVSWQLWKIDPRTGRVLTKIDLASSARHLTVIPGEKLWAFIEKDAVTAPGAQRILSVLLVPSLAIQGSELPALKRGRRDSRSCESALRTVSLLPFGFPDLERHFWSSLSYCN